MVNKYYQSLNALHFSMPMTTLAILIFAQAYLLTEGKAPSKIKITMILTAIVLVILMFFYYRNKLKIRKALKNVQNIKEYEQGGMVNRSYILEQRLLACNGLDIQEVQTKDVKELSLEEKNHGKYYLHLHCNDKIVIMSLLDKEDGQKVASYFQKRNPNIVLTNIQPKGNGTLKELGAGV